MGVALAKADGHYSTKEKDILKKFIIEKAKINDIKELNSFLTKLESLTPRTFEVITTHIKNSISALSLVSKGMELLVNLSVSDGKLETKEKTLLSKFAKEFDIDDKTVDNIVRKYIASDNFELSLEIFGITKNMTNTEKKQKLNIAYAEWNKKIISSNPQTKERARVVIDFISQERLKLANTN